MKRIYISGPITGMPGKNALAFDAASLRLLSLGYDVVNPIDLCPDPDATWAECMRIDIAALVTCNAVALLPGWQQSRGAQLEAHIARQLGMRVMVASEVIA